MTYPRTSFGDLMATWTWSTPFKSVDYTINVSNATSTTVRVLVTRTGNGAVVLDQTVPYDGGAFTEDPISAWKTTIKTAINAYG